MPKMKTHRGAAKRFRVTGTGKIKRNRANKSHIMTGKTSKRTRMLRQGTMVNDANMVDVRRMLGL